MTDDMPDVPDDALYCSPKTVTNRLFAEIDFRKKALQNISKLRAVLINLQFAIESDGLDDKPGWRKYYRQNIQTLAETTKYFEKGAIRSFFN